MQVTLVLKRHIKIIGGRCDPECNYYSDSTAVRCKCGYSIEPFCSLFLVVIQDGARCQECMDSES